jgi:hypothetical protein
VVVVPFIFDLLSSNVLLISEAQLWKRGREAIGRNDSRGNREKEWVESR